MALLAERPVLWSGLAAGEQQNRAGSGPPPRAAPLSALAAACPPS